MKLHFIVEMDNEHEQALAMEILTTLVARGLGMSPADMVNPDGEPEEPDAHPDGERALAPDTAPFPFGTFPNNPNT